MIILNVREITSLLQKTIGLIGKNTSESILIKTRFGIHTFGMRFPIDVVVLNEINQVVAYKENLLPFKLFFWNPSYNLLLELPSGTIRRHKIKTGSNIKLKFIS